MCNEPDQVFKRGDANSDQDIDLADAIFILSYLFTGTEGPECEDTGDANDDGTIDLADAIKVLSYLFTEGSGSGSLSDLCNEDLTEDLLGCSSYPVCSE